MTPRRPAPVELVDRFRPRSDAAFVRRVAAAARRFGGRPDLPVSLLLTDDAEIAALHGEFLGDPTPTDVITFPLDDGVEIVVSVECARREARARGHAIRAELALYVVHGVLHVCGYDDIEARDRARMRAAERAVLDALGVVVGAVDD